MAARGTVRSLLLKTCIFVLLTFLVKKPFTRSDSVVYDFNNYGGLINGTVIKQNVVTYAFESIYILQTSKVTCLKPSLVFHFLLLLAGDIEVCPGPNSLNATEFTQKLSMKGLKIGHQNIRGLEENFEQFELFLKSNDLDIFGLSETHLCDSNITGHLDIEGYELIKRNRSSGYGGGVCFYIKNGISFKQRSNLLQDGIENIFVEIFIKKSKSFLVGCFYRPPDSSAYLSKDFNDILSQNINRVSKEKKEMIIMGDFNIDYNDKTLSHSTHNEFKNIMSFYGLKQIITSSTRITNDSSTLIDHIFVSKPSNFPCAFVVANSISDHDVVYCRRKINSTKYHYRTIKCRNYRRYNQASLRSDVQNIDWEPIYQNTSDVNSAVSYLTENLQRIFDKHAPLIEKRVKGRPCQWINDDIKAQMNSRDQLHRKAKKSKSTEDWNAYKRKRNACTNEVKKAKSTYFRSLLNENERVNPKKFWKTIKTIFPSKPKTIAPCTGSDRVNRFSDYYSTIVQKLKSVNFPLRDSVWRYYPKKPLRTKHIFKFSFVTTGYILKQLNHLKRNKATGVDLLPPNLLKDCSEQIAGPLCHIINLSFQTCTVPSLWKSAKVNPVFKSGGADLVENYRPISILPILSKVLERAVHDQLYEFMEDHKLLSDCQYGFRKKRSTKLAAALLCDSVRQSFEDGQMVGCLFLDLSKAFDTMGHNIIIEKLLLHGVSGPELNWMTDYLFNRTQTVEVGNNSSSKKPIKSGVPQGSILGPLLFIIFFNDLENTIHKSQIIQFADDTVIFFNAKTISEIEDALNSDLSAIVSYCKLNELILNFEKGKTEVLLLGTAQRLKKYGSTLNIVHDNTIVNQVTQYCYLGNTIDQHMTLTENFNKAYKKAAGRIRLLYSVRKYLSSKAANNIYEMMILPIMTYSCTIKTSYTDGQINRLKGLQNRVAYIIGNDSVKCIKTNADMKVQSLVKKCINRELNHPVFDKYFELLRHSKHTRRNNKILRLPKIRLESSRPSFKFGGAIIFNKQINF